MTGNFGGGLGEGGAVGARSSRRVPRPSRTGTVVIISCRCPDDEISNRVTTSLLRPALPSPLPTPHTFPRLYISIIAKYSDRPRAPRNIFLSPQIEPFMKYRKTLPVMFLRYQLSNGYVRLVRKQIKITSHLECEFLT